MALLSVSSGLDDSHDDVLGRHEGELLADTTSNDPRVDDKTLRDVLKSAEKDVGGEERLGNGNSAVGAAMSLVDD